jgi:hypothetical protein
MKLTRLDSIVFDAPTKPIDAALAIRNQIMEDKLKILRDEFKGDYMKYVEGKAHLQENDQKKIEENEDSCSIQEVINDLRTENRRRERLKGTLMDCLHMARLQNAADEVTHFVIQRQIHLTTSWTRTRCSRVRKTTSRWKRGKPTMMWLTTFL